MLVGSALVLTTGTAMAAYDDEANWQRMLALGLLGGAWGGGTQYLMDKV